MQHIHPSIILLTFLFLTSPLCLAQSPANAPGTLNKDQEAWLSRSERHEKNGWIYVHIEGTPRQRGFQYGYLLSREITESMRVQRVQWTYHSGMDWAWLVARSKKMFTPRLDKELLNEIDGIVEGLKAAGVTSTRNEMVAYNAYIELTDYWWPKQKEEMDSGSPNPRRESCSSFIATGSMTADRGIVLGHNTMSGYAGADSYVILDILPAKGHRILMQTSPGWIHSGTDFFITDAGLVGSETTIGKFNGFNEAGIPEFVRMRRATQDASSIDEWCTILRKGNNGGYANAWLLGDVNTDEIARLELGLEHVGFERTKDGFFVGSNLAENLKLLRLETEEHETDIRYSGVSRRVRWKQLMKHYAGKITLELARDFEADHYDSYLRLNTLGARSLCAHCDRDSIEIELPFEPWGTVDAKVVDSKMAKRMAFAARWGSGCGTPFDAQEFLELHPQFDWMAGILKSRPSFPWTEFQAGEKK